MRNAKESVSTSSKPDLSGKSVDKIIPPEVAFMIYFDEDHYQSTDPAKVGALAALQKLSMSPNKKIRQRDFVVYFGTMRNSDGENLFAIGLPKRVPTEVAQLFFAALEPFYHLDWGDLPLADFSPEPLARYIDGEIIIYTYSSSPPGWLPEQFEVVKSWNIEWETRSATGPAVEDLGAQSKPHPLHYHHIPQTCLPERPINGRHTVQEHQRLSEALNKILFPSGRSAKSVMDASAPFGYKQLRNLCENHLGISVEEDRLPGGYSGMLRVGRASVDEDGNAGAQVLIRINRLLPPETKYVALAHELAHYRFHFLWLLTSNIAFDLALRAPEAVVILNNILRKREKMAEELEWQADLYSSYFLLPLMYDAVDALSKIVFLSTRNATVQEIAWDLLARFFQDENIGHFSWKEYEARSQSAIETWLRLSLGMAPRSLFERYFAVILERITHKRDVWSFFGHDSVYNAVELIYLFSSLSKEGIDLRSRVRKLLDDKIRSEGWQKPSSIEEFRTWFTELALAYLGPEAMDSMEVILPSKRIETNTLCPVTVLVPLEDVPMPSIDGKLVPLPSMSAEIAAEREEWIARLPDHLLLIAYMPQKALVSLTRDAADVPRLILLPTLENLDMRFDRDWYGAVVCLGGKHVELPRSRVAGRLEEWSVFCAKHALRPEFQRLSKTQKEDLARLKLAEPDITCQILEHAKSVQEIELMIARMKSALSLEVLPWEREDYFDSSMSAYDYAMRLLQECVNGRLFDGDFWDLMFRVEKIFRIHKVPLDIRREALEIIREEIVDNELCGFFEPWFKCSECGRSFMPVLSREYVQSTLTTKKVLCRNCSMQCVEREVEDA